MRILCLDDEELALQMLEMSVKKAAPEAEVWFSASAPKDAAAPPSAAHAVSFVPW